MYFKLWNTDFSNNKNLFELSRNIAHSMDKIQPELCEGMYQQFSAIVQEMTDLCKECENELEEFKKNLQEKVIHEKV